MDSRPTEGVFGPDGAVAGDQDANNGRSPAGTARSGKERRPAGTALKRRITRTVRSVRARSPRSLTARGG